MDRGLNKTSHLGTDLFPKGQRTNFSNKEALRITQISVVFVSARLKPRKSVPASWQANNAELTSRGGQLGQHPHESAPNSPRYSAVDAIPTSVLPLPE